jgi:hypothetical protein
VILSPDAYDLEISTVGLKSNSAAGFYTTLPFSTFIQNASTFLELSSSRNNNAYAFTTTSTDYPWILPTSYVNPDVANYTNTFDNFQCFTTIPPTQSPSRAPSSQPSLAPSVAPSQQPSAAPTVAPNIISTLKPTATPSLAPSQVRMI